MEDSLKLFLEKEQIKDLLRRERYYRDSQQWQKLRDSYLPDPSATRINISWFNGNAEEFVQGSIRMSAKGTNAIHSFTPIEVHINGSKAVSEAVGSIMTRFAQGSAEYDMTSYGRFIARLEKVEGVGWRLKTLELIYDRDSTVPAAPTDEVLQMGLTGRRQSYKHLAFALEKGGFKVNDNLPGTDRPETVTKLMEEVFGWLHS